MQLGAYIYCDVSVQIYYYKKYASVFGLRAAHQWRVFIPSDARHVGQIS